MEEDVPAVAGGVGGGEVPAAHGAGEGEGGDSFDGVVGTSGEAWSEGSGGSDGVAGSSGGEGEALGGAGEAGQGDLGGEEVGGGDGPVHMSRVVDRGASVQSRPSLPVCSLRRPNGARVDVANRYRNPVDEKIIYLSLVPPVGV